MKRHETKIDDLMHERRIKNDSQLADELNVSQQVLSSRLKDNISINTLETLSKYFGVGVKELIR